MNRLDKFPSSLRADDGLTASHFGPEVRMWEVTFRRRSLGFSSPRTPFLANFRIADNSLETVHQDLVSLTGAPAEFLAPVVLGKAPRPVYFCFGFGCAALILSKASLALWFAGSSFRAFS